MNLSEWFMASFHLNSSVHIANFRAKFLLLVETLKKSSFSMKFFIGPSRVRIPPRTQTQQKRGASVNFVIIFLVVSRSFKTVTTACCIRKKVTICAAYSLRWGKKLKKRKRKKRAYWDARFLSTGWNVLLFCYWKNCYICHVVSLKEEKIWVSDGTPMS